MNAQGQAQGQAQGVAQGQAPALTPAQIAAQVRKRHRQLYKEYNRINEAFSKASIPCAGQKGREKRLCGCICKGKFFCNSHSSNNKLIPKTEVHDWKARMVGTADADRKRVQLALYRFIVKTKEAKERREANRIAERARAIRRQMHDQALDQFIAEQAEMAKADKEEAFSDEDDLAEFELEAEEKEEQRQQQEQQMQH